MAETHLQNLMRMEYCRVYVDLIEANRVPQFSVSFDIPSRKVAVSQYSEDFDRDRARLAAPGDAELLSLFNQCDAQVKTAEKRRPGAATLTRTLS